MADTYYQIIGDTLLFQGGTPPISIKKDLLPCGPDQLSLACSMITPAPQKDATVTSVNYVLANIQNKENVLQIGPTFDSSGKLTGQIIDLGKPNSEGLQYVQISDSNSSPTIGPTIANAANLDTIETNPATALPTSTSSTSKPYTYNSQSTFPEYDTLSGSDLSVFYLAEVIDQSDLDKGIPSTIAKRNLVMVEFDSVLSLTYSTIRERFPVRSLGYSNPRGITNGIRTVSGHIAFNIFTEDVLSKLRSGVVSQTEKLLSVGPPSPATQNVADADKILGLNQQYSTANKGNPLASQCKTMLLDQLPPFHLLIMGVTERGMLSRMMIKNVSIIDENQYQGTQQPNIINKVSWVAQDIVPMTATQYSSTFVSGSLSSLEEGYVGGNWDYNGVANMTASGLLDMQASSVNRSSLGGL